MLPYEDHDPLFEAPAYSLASAARYLRLNLSSLRQWVSGPVPLICLPSGDGPSELSFTNLLECHIIRALRERLLMSSIRDGIQTAKRLYETDHPLLDSRARTDGQSLLFHAHESGEGSLVNVSRGGQIAMSPIVSMFLERIRWDEAKFFPFVKERSRDEPNIVSIGPRIASGRSVIDGTGISTAVIASRFAAREKPSALAREYGLDEEQVYEAIRWEHPYRTAA